jgi:hypothetical protein
MADPVVISAAVEGILDEAVIQRLVSYCGGQLGYVHGRKGKGHVRQRIGGYHQAAQYHPWLIVVDLDRDFDCAAHLRDAWLPAGPGPSLCFRVAVRTVEAWLMGDSESLAAFLGIGRNKIAADPEALDDPKTVMVNLARGSRRREIREDMTPEPESGRVVGRAYSSRLNEYVIGYWRPEVAAQRVDSLRRALACLTRLVQSPG